MSTRDPSLPTSSRSRVRPPPPDDRGRLASDAERFSAPAQETLYKRIANHVRELIVSEQLRPGERLPAERELAQRLGVSRVPIREAMRTLAAQGLVEIRRGQGMFVASRALGATIDQLATVILKQRNVLADLFAVRRLLEPASAAWAATRAEEDDVVLLERLVSDIREAATGEPDFETIGERDTQLHIAIAATSQNYVLLRIMKALQDLHQEQLETSLRYTGRLSETVKDHSRIVAAISSHDPVEARAAMVDHLANSEAATMARLEGDDHASPPRESRRAAGGGEFT